MNEQTIQNPSRVSLFAEKLFLFFASVRLAVCILTGLILVFAAGTIIESLYGMEAAWVLVYRAPWFTILGFFLVINLTASTLTRLPWKKKHIGFVMTHLGIITILSGAFITQNWMVDAQLAIEEGKTEHRLRLQEPILYAFAEKSGREWVVPLKRRAFAWEGWQALASEEPPLPGRLTLLRFYPKGRMQQEFEAAATGEPAVFVEIENSFIHQTLWLVRGHERFGQTQLGPARFRFAGELLEETHLEDANRPYLEFQLGEKNTRLSIPEKTVLPLTRPLEGTPYQIVIEGVYRNAVIAEQKIREGEGPEEGEGRNPAVVLRLRGAGVNEKHTVFLNFPDFPTRHGLAPGALDIKIHYRKPNGGSKGETHELRFVETAEGLMYQIVDGASVQTGKVETGRQISTGWMDLKFKVREYLPHARIRRFFTPEKNTTESTEAFRAIEVEFAFGGQRESFWLASGTGRRIATEHDIYHFVFGEKQLPLDFKVTLDDFRIQHYQGTADPASYESDVTVRDDFKGLQKKVTISMNEPFDYNGYRLFQASYIQEPGTPDVSIFSVVRDPGIWMKYIGTVIMISGIMTMFATRGLTFLKGNQKIA